MRVLFIYTNINVRGGALSYPFGIGQVSAVLRQHGHDTRLYQMFDRYDVAPIRAILKEYRPDVVGFSVSYPQWRFVKRVLEDLQPWKAFTICGGAHPTVVPDHPLNDAPALNAICIGEGEYPMLELVDALRDGKPIENIPNLWVRRKDGTIAQNAPRPFIKSLDDLPFYDREMCDYQAIIDSDFKIATFQFGRGCPYNCTYCSNHVIRNTQDGPYVRYRSVSGALEEIRQVTTQFKVVELYLNDDTFLAKKSWFEEFLDRYPREFNLPFSINARSEQINEDVCRRLAAAHCQRVTMGVEHGNEQYRAEVLQRRMPNDSIIQAFDLCRKYGFSTKAHFLIGLPYETPALHEDTVRLASRIMPDSFTLHIFEPYPGTRLGDIAWKEKLVDPARENTEFVGQADTMLNLPGFPRREILKCFRRFSFRVYRKHSLMKAIPFYIYYSRWGEPLIRTLTPIKRVVRKLAMKM